MKKIFLVLISILCCSAQAYVDPQLEDAINLTDIEIIKAVIYSPSFVLTKSEHAGLLDLAAERVDTLKSAVKETEKAKKTHTSYNYNTGTTHTTTAYHYEWRDDVGFVPPYSTKKINVLSALGVIGMIGVPIACAIGVVALLPLSSREGTKAALGISIPVGAVVGAIPLFIAGVYESRNNEAYVRTLKEKLDEAIKIKQLIYRIEAIR